MRNKGPLLRALHEAGFELYTSVPVSASSTRPVCDMEEVPLRGVVDKLNPLEFAQKLRSMACLVGLGDPKLAPSALEAVANGAAWIDPGGQNPQISKLGSPYAYSYEKSDPSSLVRAAEQAHQNRFESFVPPELSLERAKASVQLYLLAPAPCGQK